MTTVDLREKDLDVQDLLRLAESDSVLIIAKDGHGFTLEGADDFDREVATLGASRNFMRSAGERKAWPSLAETKRRPGQGPVKVLLRGR